MGSDGNCGFDMRIGVVIFEGKVLKFEVEDAFDIAVDDHARQGAWSA